MMGASQKSRVLTLVFTDLADSTALKTARGDQAVGELIVRHRAHVTRLAEESSGRVIDWAGDGCFLTFETSSAAVMFSLRLQQVHAEEADLPGVRIGVHMGEVTERSGPGEAVRIEGLAVDIAARVGSLAKPGQVLMSSAVYSSARQRLGVDTFGQPILWQAHGTYSLKGFDQPVDIGEAGLEGLSPLEAPTAGDKVRLLKRAPKSTRTTRGGTTRRQSGLPKFAALASLIIVTLILGLWLGRQYGAPSTNVQPASPNSAKQIKSLAVLPLVNMSNDPEQDFFADGLTDTLTSELAKIGSIRVISRTSTLKYRDTTKSMTEIAAELNVDALIEGSVYLAGNEVRIAAQLIDGTTDSHLWSETYTGTLENVIALQGEVALSIAKEIGATITPEEEVRLTSAEEVHPEAYQAYLRGLNALLKVTPDGIEEAAEHFSESLSHDSDFAYGHLGLSAAYYIGGMMGIRLPIDAYPLALSHATQAIALDETLGSAHSMVGATSLVYTWDWETAEREMLRGIELTPNSPEAHFLYSGYMNFAGVHRQAMDEILIAQSLEPDSTLYLHAEAGIHSAMGNFDRAISVLQATLELDPVYVPATIGLSRVYARTGQRARAMAELDKLAAMLGADSPMLSIRRIMVHVLIGDVDSAKAAMEGLDQEMLQNPAYSAVWAIIHAQLGDNDRAFEFLEKGLDAKMGDSLGLRTPLLETLHDDPRYWDLIERVGFPPLPPTHKGYAEEQAWLARKAAAERGVEPIERIAVLPFANISGDPKQEWFVDGMTEALTMELAKIKALTVVSRTSAMQYKGVIRPMQEIASELGVDALIEGSVYRVGDKVRITAQLIDGRTDKHLWADRYDGTLDDILNLQSEVALAIAKEIHIVLTPEEETRLTTARSIDTAAHEAYLRGRHIWAKRTSTDMFRAIELFEEAVRIEPGYALAYAAIADAYNLLGVYVYMPPEEAYDKALESARRALAIDDTLAAAHTSLAWTLGIAFYDLDGAILEFGRALELDPKSVQAHAWYATTLSFMGRPEEGLEMAEKAIALDPVSPLTGAVKIMVLFMLGHQEKAVEFARGFQELQPDFVLLLMNLGNALITSGDYDEAIVVEEHLAEVNERHVEFLGYLGLAYAKAGRREDALAILEEVKSKVVTEATGAYTLALVHFGLGDIEQTLTLLEQSIEERHRGNLELNAYPLWDPLRDDPRFQGIIEKLNLPE